MRRPVVPAGENISGPDRNVPEKGEQKSQKHNRFFHISSISLDDRRSVGPRHANP
jgi:hypothetical protein